MQNDPHCEGKSLKRGGVGTKLMLLSNHQNVTVRKHVITFTLLFCHHSSLSTFKVVQRILKNVNFITSRQTAVMAKSEENENLFSNYI